MRGLPLLTLLMIVVPAIAGCAQDNPAHDELPGAPAPAEDSTVPGAAGPDSAYRVTPSSEDDEPSSERVAYPLLLPANRAKAPLTITHEGAFEPGQCSPSGDIPVPTRNYHRYDIGEELEPGDVFSYAIQLTFTNTEDAWGEIHLSYSIGNTYGVWREPTAEARGEIRQNFTGQSYRTSDEDTAWLAASCWHGMTKQPIPYIVTVTYTFVENVVPAEVPIQFSIPEGASALYVTGVPIDASERVLSHYRIFGPDEALLCECALNTNEATDAYPLPGPGDYVILIDHTAGGFLALALDTPTEMPLRPLQVVWEAQPLLSSPGGAVDETLSVEIPYVPLAISVWYSDTHTIPLDPGLVKNLHIDVTNARGQVLSESHAGFAGFWLTPGADQPPRRTWLPLPTPGEWDGYTDHHALDKGTHQAHVQAEWLRGTLDLWTKRYVREA